MKRSLFIFLSLLFLVIGYASVNTLLNINGTLKIGVGNFDVRINNTIIDGADVSSNIIADDGKSFKVNLTKSSVVDFDIENSSLEYDAIVYLSCVSKGEPNSYIYTYITDNYIKANGSSHAQAYLNFNNLEYSVLIDEMSARINVLSNQYENGTNTENDRISIRQEIDFLVEESNRLSRLMINEDELTCSIGLSSIEKTTLEDKTYTDDITFISANEGENNYTPYIYNNNKSIKFSSDKDVKVEVNIRNDSDTPAFYSISCTNDRALTTDAFATSSPSLGFIDKKSTAIGNIYLYLNQESSKNYIEGIKNEIKEAKQEIIDMNARIEVLENMKKNDTITDDDRYYIDLEISALEEEKIRVNEAIVNLEKELEEAEDRYAPDDNVTCHLNVERFDTIPKDEEDNIDIKIDNVLMDGKDITSESVSDKVNLELTAKDNSIINFNVKNNSNYDVVADIECSTEKNTYPYYFLNNIIIKKNSFVKGGIRTYFYDNHYTYKKINSYNIQEAYILRVMNSEEYQDYPEDEKKRFESMLEEVKLDREEEYKNVITDDKISCRVSVINFEQ